METIKGQTSIDDFLGDLLKQQPKKNKTPKPATSAITKATRINSYRKTEKQPLRQLVLETLGNYELTAREIAIEMHKRGLIAYPARAVIQPRITELVESGELKAIGEKMDEMTQRNVAVYKAV